MPDLLSVLKPKFEAKLRLYHQTYSSITSFYINHPYLSLLMPPLAWEGSLAGRKHAVVAKYLQPDPQDAKVDPGAPQLVRQTTVGSVSSSMSATTEATKPNVKKVVATPKQRRIDAIAVKERRLDVFHRQFKSLLADVENVRQQHAAGQLEGICTAIKASTNYMIRFYTKHTTVLFDNIDNVDESSDTFLRLYQLLAQFLAELAYDYCLLKYNDDRNGHKIDDQYLLNPTLKYVPKEYLKSFFEAQYCNLYLVGLYHSQMQVGKCLCEGKVLDDNQQRILSTKQLYHGLFTNKHNHTRDYKKALESWLVTIAKILDTFSNLRNYVPHGHKLQVLEDLIKLEKTKLFFAVPNDIPDHLPEPEPLCNIREREFGSEVQADVNRLEESEAQEVKIAGVLDDDELGNDNDDSEASAHDGFTSRALLTDDENEDGSPRASNPPSTSPRASGSPAVPPRPQAALASSLCGSPLRTGSGSPALVQYGQHRRKPSSPFAPMVSRTPPIVSARVPPPIPPRPPAKAPR